MKAIISSTYDSKYLFYLPIVTYCWDKLGVDVICFMPQIAETENDRTKYLLAIEVCRDKNLDIQTKMFECPKNKEATYAQCSRLYAACLDLPKYEILITSDVDMIVFNLPKFNPDVFSIFGYDLVPKMQFPMCYIAATAKHWIVTFKLSHESYQQCLDNLLGKIEAEHFRGNYWGKDQETAYYRIAGNEFNPVPIEAIKRAKEGTQFATHRLDRDDAYLLDRLNPDIIDYHLPRPGYEENNFKQIMTVLKYFYPNDDLTWIENYREEYIKLL